MPFASCSSKMAISAKCKSSGPLAKSKRAIPSPPVITSQLLLPPSFSPTQLGPRIITSCHLGRPAYLPYPLCSYLPAAALQLQNKSLSLFPSSLPPLSPLPLCISPFGSATRTRIEAKTTWAFLNVTLPYEPVRLSASRRTCVCTTHASQVARVIASFSFLPKNRRGVDKLANQRSHDLFDPHCLFLSLPSLSKVTSIYLSTPCSAPAVLLYEHTT